MKLLTLRAGGGHHAAVMVGEDVLDLVLAADVIDEARAIPGSIREILCGGEGALARVAAAIAATADAADRLRSAGALFPFAQAALGPVIPDPNMFISIGANSRGHVAEMGGVPPAVPEGFFKVRTALSASGDTISAPSAYADKLDWEGEFCAVVGRSCHRVTVEEADAHIVGYTLTNDVSARDNVREFMTAEGRAAVVSALFTLIQLKNLPGFAPVGPVIATKDEFPADGDYQMETIVSGQVMQRSNRADLVFSPAEVLSYLSQFYRFEPGDIFSLGSPPGVGMAQKPPRFLTNGDVVAVKVKEIGTLTNPIGAPY